MDFRCPQDALAAQIFFCVDVADGRAASPCERGDDAEQNEFKEQVRAARAHEGDRRAGDRHKTDADAHVYRQVRGEEDENTEREERVEVGRGSAGDLQQSGEEESVQGEQEENTDESPFLRICGEDEIGLIFGQETEL